MSGTQGTTRRTFLKGVGTIVAGASWGALARPRRAFALSPVAGAGLGPPSNASYMIPIIRDLGLDKKHDLDFQFTAYRRLGAMYSDFAAGKWMSVYCPGFFNAANFYVRGIPIQLMFTYTTANHAFVSKDPSIRQAADLKGKTVAATTSSAFWGMAVLFLRRHGLDSRKDLKVLHGAPPAVRTQLVAGKVDAGIVWEPNLSQMLTSGFHLVGDMTEGIRKETGLASDAPVWYLGAYGWKKWLDEDHDRNARILQMWQDAVSFYYAEPEKADQMVSQFTKVPLEALKYSRAHKFVTFKVLPASQEKANIHKTLEGFKSVGFLKQLPDDGLYYTWPGLKG